MKNLVKTDQSILEFPLWLLDPRLEPFQKFEIENEYGKFVLKCGERPPDSTDSLFLYSLMKLSQDSDSPKVILSNRSGVLRMCGLSISSKNYNRLWESLRRWKEVTANFAGCFTVKGGGHVKMIFGVLEYAEYNEDTRVLEIKFNDKFFEIVKQSQIYRYIDLDYYRMLKRPISRRLYEILKKHLEQNNEWKFEAVKLAEKLTLALKYPSQILRQLKPAVNEIAGSDLKIEIDHYKNADGKTIVVFRRIDKIKPKTKGKPDPLKPLSGKIGKKVRQKKTITKAETERRKKELLKQLNESGI